MPTLLLAAGPANVLLVENASSPVSVRIGEYYAKKRGIPARNICRIRTAPVEFINRKVYLSEIAAPIEKCLRSRKLEETVLYLVTTLGVPLAVRGRVEKNGDYAAVDSELTLLYSAIKGRKTSLDGPVPNPFFTQSQTPFRHPAFPIYLVTRLAAYSFETVARMVDNCLAARNTGKFVLDLRSGDPEEGNRWLRNAAFLLPPGRVVIDESTKVLSGIGDVIAYVSWGSNDRNRSERFLKFGWLPGAIMTEYVSSNGRTFVRPPSKWTLGTWNNPSSHYAQSPQSLAADYLEEGATGAAGHTSEPYLSNTPRPDFLLPAYYAGRNLAESYYVSIPSLSWQNIVLGDPLCSIGPPE